MNKSTHSALSLIAMVLLVGMGLTGVRLNSQQTAPQQTPNQPSQQAPDSQAQSQQSQSQTFAGTIVKAGEKYVLQDTSGTTYDVDRQDLAKQHEGQKVRIKGTLDPDRKTIHVK